ncbi:unnamed protein product [Bursaphelenchus xylophilus]|uniref:non-specific serine/threonine protein kinase n=1 Tax=Bursaphelenchus xylophilus TaxID=6326 RepID=A0A1I7SXB5_BURXY|nr:unnamed protein product [Bursaphelenchus xylophilus]CAG9100308.1 unnamed protein product [Bursaphelenchus xylophilus]
MEKVITPVYVFQLPPKVVWGLGDILDGGNLWEEIAKAMPDIKAIDIEACRRTEKPTESLLRVWGSKGYKVLDLFKVFGRCQFVRCLDLLKPYVDPKFHNITMSTEKSVLSPRSTQPSEPVNRLDNTQPSTVYSKRAPSQIEPLLLSEGDSVQSSNEIFSGLHTIPAIKYEDIQDMTGNFAVENVCGKGGYGVVYRGMWKHMPVAVKRIQARKGGQLEHQKERIRQSLQELRHLSKLRHDNILSLYGYSMDGPEPCLLYQFMPGGSLEDRLLCRNNTPPLSWETKMSISVGAALGLHFLHTIGTAPIIHGDVKCANILLDKHLEPKLGDFGLSRDGQVELDADDKSPMIASHIKGTLAYLPPEFTRSKILTTKLDVYSFGVVLLEVATGQRAYSDNREPHGLVSFVAKRCHELRRRSNFEEELIKELADRRVAVTRESPQEAVFRKLLHWGSLASVEDRLKRPAFSEIVVALQE